MKISTLLAMAVWAFVVGGNIVSTLTGSAQTFAGAPELPWFVVLLQIIIVIGAFRKRTWRREVILSKFIDNLFGGGTYQEFVRTLKFELMFAAMCFCIVISAVVRAVLLNSPVFPPVMLGFFTSGGVAFVAAYYIRQRRKAA